MKSTNPSATDRWEQKPGSQTLHRPVAVKRPESPSVVCVLPAFNEANNLTIVVPKISDRLSKHSANFKIMIVDDGSTDDTATVALELAAGHAVVLVQLSRNFGKEAAISAGLDLSDADVVVIMDADGQHPVETLDEFFRCWRDGYDMVYGVRTNRTGESAVKQYCAKFFYRLLSRNKQVRIHPNAGDFRLLDRRAVLAIRRLPERSRMMKGLFAWVGFPSKAVGFEVAPRSSGVSSFGLLRLVSLAVTGYTSFSNAPLRIWTLIGATASALALLYGLVVVLSTLIFGADVPGWPTITAGILFMGGIQLLSIGVLGEYIARIFSEVKARPLYLIDQIYDSAESRNEDARDREAKT